MEPDVRGNPVQNWHGANDRGTTVRPRQSNTGLAMILFFLVPNEQRSLNRRSFSGWMDGVPRHVMSLALLSLWRARVIEAAFVGLIKLRSVARHPALSHVP